MEQKGMSAAAIAVIVVVFVAVGVGGAVYFLVLAPGAPLGGGGAGGGVGTTGIAAMPGSTKCGDIGGSSGSSFLSSMSSLGGTSVTSAELAGVKMDIYKTSSSVPQIIDYYKVEWSKEGYTENVCQTIDFSQIPYASTYGLSGSLGVALYQKGEQMIGAIAMEYQNEKYYVLMSASVSDLQKLAEAYSSGWSY